MISRRRIVGPKALPEGRFAVVPGDPDLCLIQAQANKTSHEV